MLIHKHNPPQGGVQLVQEHTSGPLANLFLSSEARLPCFLGLSLRNKMSNRRHLELIVPWLFAHSSNVVIVVGDYLDRFNRVAFDKLSFSNAAQKVLQKGKRTIRYANEIIQSHGLGDHVRVLSSADVTESQDCRLVFADLKQCYAKGGPFVVYVAQEVACYLVRTQRDCSSIDEVETYSLLADYVLEELALFIALYDRGFHIEVYPGPDLAIMKALATGACNAVPFRCPHRTHISILTHLKSDR